MSVPPAIRDHVRAGRRAKRRGERGEREIVELLKAFGWTRARRNFGSGSQGGGDVVGGPEGCCIEVKLTERLKLREAFEQCASASGGDMPLVVHRCNSQPWLATVELDELLELLALKERGC